MKILAQTILGSPAAECAHFGICKIEKMHPATWDSFVAMHIRHVKTIIRRPEKHNWFCLEFPLDAMRYDTFDMFFASGFFRLDSEGTLPDEIAEPLGLEIRVFTAGNYPLEITDMEIRLELPAIKGVVTSGWNSTRIQSSPS